MYRVYTMLLNINGIVFTEAWIDPHYEQKHKDSINDELILELIQIVNFYTFELHDINSEGYEFYEIDVNYLDKSYRLILTFPPHKMYMGVVNAYRRAK